MSTTWEGNLKYPLAAREKEVYFGASVLKRKNIAINPERKNYSSLSKVREVLWRRHALPWRLGDTRRAPSAQECVAESWQFSFDLEHLEKQFAAKRGNCATLFIFLEPVERPSEVWSVPAEKMTGCHASESKAVQTLFSTRMISVQIHQHLHTHTWFFIFLKTHIHFPVLFFYSFNLNPSLYLHSSTSSLGTFSHLMLVVTFV